MSGSIDFQVEIMKLHLECERQKMKVRKRYTMLRRDVFQGIQNQKSSRPTTKGNQAWRKSKN